MDIKYYTKPILYCHINKRPETWIHPKQLLYSLHKLNMWLSKYQNYRVKTVALIIPNLIVHLITLKLDSLADVM